MRKLAVSAMAALGVALVIVVALLVRSSGHAASLEDRISMLETDRANLQSEASSARKQATDLQAQNAELQAKLRPLETKQAAVTRINQELVVQAGTIQRFEFTPSVVPGTLSGSWRSSGQGFGGANDTIAAFRLTDPQDSIIESSSSSAGAPSSGRFFVKVSAHGTYTFFFDNKGLLRNTSRRIFIEGDFRPE